MSRRPARGAPRPTRPGGLTALCFNLKYASEHPPHAWPDRRGLVAQAIRGARPALVATQEGLYRQLRDVAADTGLSWVGLGRDGGAHGEFCAILYDPAVLDPLDYDHFWLSATPAWVGSRTPWWGNSSVRIATWVRFRLLATGADLVWLNTHLDNDSATARFKGAAQIGRWCRGVDRGLPLVVSGDFNCAVDSRPYEQLTRGAGLADAWQLAGAAPSGTYGGWGMVKPAGDRIDWVLLRGPVTATGAEVVDHHDPSRGEEGWPSDHLPVRVSLSVGGRCGPAGP
ncbi:MAG: endonuclease/exonuclease/phosphatase family protein [Mycobacteriales bacterium]